MTEQEKLNENVRAVDRALDILMAFNAGDRELTAGDLLKRVDLSRPTLYRLLRTLEHKGFIASSGEPQRFQLGPSVAHLAHVWSSHMDVVSIAQPMMQRLWEQTQETVSLLLLQGVNRVCVAEMPSPQALSFKRGVGHVENVVLGASGRAILAFTPDPDRYIQSAKYVPEPDRYMQELTKIREAGYATSRDELIKGAVAIAAPIFAGGNRVFGSLAVFGPSVRIDANEVQRVANLVRHEAENLSKALGKT